MSSISSTICAIATAPGGAIGIVRVSGPQAIELTDKVFRGGKALAEAQAYTLNYGHIVDGQQTLDEVLVSVFRAPNSYTGEDSTEISCHGSTFILQRVIELLVHHGCTLAQPGEFTQRAFLSGKMDLSQAEAVADLIASRNAATHRMAMSQLRGGFSRELGLLRDQLLHLTSLLELELDFTDHEELEFADRSQLHSLCTTIDDRITHLADSFQTGNAIKNGIPVAIIGAPNVGKSTLLNALLHEEKAIVSDIQGTTRDLIEDVIQIGGVVFRFIDTAGVRKTDDTIERLGIERSLQAAERAQIIILLSESDKHFPDIRLPEGKTILRVINKSDRLYPPSSFVYNTHRPGAYFYISARTGAGLPLLERELVKAAAIPEIAANDTIITNLRHYQALTSAHTDLQRVAEGLTMQLPTDLIAMDLRQCLFHLAEITGGQITTDEVLGNIFSHFCIGK